MPTCPSYRVDMVDSFSTEHVGGCATTATHPHSWRLAVLVPRRLAQEHLQFSAPLPIFPWDQWRVSHRAVRNSHERAENGAGEKW